MTHYEEPNLDSFLGIQVYLHEGTGWVQNHWHKELEIVHAIEGIVTIEIDNQIIHVKKGESIIISPRESHSFISSPGSVRLAIHFTLDSLVKSVYGEFTPVYLENFLAKILPYSSFWDNKIEKKYQCQWII